MLGGSERCDVACETCPIATRKEFASRVSSQAPRQCASPRQLICPPARPVFRSAATAAQGVARDSLAHVVDRSGRGRVSRAAVALLAFLTLACLVIGHPHRESPASSAPAAASLSHVHESRASEQPNAPHHPTTPVDENDRHCAATTAAACALPNASGVALLLFVLALAIGLVWRPLPVQRSIAGRSRWRHGDLALLSWPGRPALAVLCVSRR